MIYREGEQALDSPVLEMHSLTWRLGYVDPHDETVPLWKLLDMARRRRLTIYADHRQDQLKDSPFEGALMLRLGDQDPRFFCVLWDSVPLLGDYMPVEDYQLLTDAVVVIASNSRPCKTTY